MIDLRVTKLFFDKPKVIRAVNRAKKGGLSRAGGWIRKTARQSMRVRKGSSPPGQPPYAHTRLLKDFLFYSWDQRTESVVIGPAKLHRRRRGRRSTVPNLLEFGGSTRRPDYWRGAKKKMHIAPRPYMGPALQKADQAGVLMDAWRNSVRGGP